MRRTFSTALAVCLIISYSPGLLAESTETAANASKLTGKVFAADGTPLEGAKVLAYHLSSEALYESAPSVKGGYEIANLPHGYFDLAVETPEGLFVGNKVVNVPPSGKASIVFNLADFQAGGDTSTRGFPGSNQTPAGMAQMQQKSGGFLKSTTGIAVIAGVGGVALLAIAAGGGGGGDSSDPGTSPFLP